LKNEQQLEVLKIAEKYIHAQFKAENKKFENINKKYKKLYNFDVLTSTETFTGIPEGNERVKILRQIFDSQEYVIVVRDKYRLMALILKMSDINNYSSIFNSDIMDVNNQESDIYYNEIINHRNKLAHNKLTYGEKCKNRIKIIKIIEDIICACSNNECEKSYNYDECKKLRENIYKYYLLFDGILDPILKIELERLNHA